MNKIKSAEDFDSMSELDQTKSALRGRKALSNLKMVTSNPSPPRMKL